MAAAIYAAAADIADTLRFDYFRHFRFHISIAYCHFAAFLSTPTFRDASGIAARCQRASDADAIIFR
jgi:hypothetical protein